MKFKISNRMIEKKEDNLRSESYYPDSSFYIDKRENDVSDKGNSSEHTTISKDQISNAGANFEWPNTYWFIAERTNGRLAMMGFMAVIINYILFGWIAYPIL